MTEVSMTDLATLKKQWWKSKTIMTAFLAIAASGSAFAAGEMQMSELIMAVTGSLAVIFLRDGQGKPVEWKKKKE